MYTIHTGLDALAAKVATEFERVAGRHDDPKVYGGPAGDPGLIGPGSLSWRIHGDLASVALAGTAAITLEVLHPSVIAGVQDNSRYREDPFRRARATLGYVLATTFGSTAAATRTIEYVKRIHSRITGNRPDGTAYRALDPELLAWVHTSIPWMIMRTYERFCAPLTAHERDRYLTEQARIGIMAGADYAPTTVADLEDYVEAMRPKLAVTTQTHEFIDFLLSSPLGPALPAVLRTPIQRFGVRAGLSLAPEWAQELVGFGHPSALVRTMFDPHLRANAALLRWALGTPPYLRMAQARACGLPPEDAEPPPVAPTHAVVT